MLATEVQELKPKDSLNAKPTPDAAPAGPPASTLEAHPVLQRAPKFCSAWVRILIMKTFSTVETADML